MNEFEEMNVKVDDGVAVVTLDRPERLNAWTARMGQELSRAFRTLDGDPDVRVIVLTGAGRAFCVGLIWEVAQRRSTPTAPPTLPTSRWCCRGSCASRSSR